MLVKMLSSPTLQESLGAPPKRTQLKKTTLRLEYKQIFYFKATKDLCVLDPRPSVLSITAS